MARGGDEAGMVKGVVTKKKYEAGRKNICSQTSATTAHTLTIEVRFL